MIEWMASPVLSGAAFLHHRGREGHGGLQLAQISRQSGAIQLMQGLQAESAFFANDDLELITLPKTGSTQEISRKPHGQAVGPAADRLLNVLTCIGGPALRPGGNHGAMAL